MSRDFNQYPLDLVQELAAEVLSPLLVPIMSLLDLLTYRRMEV
jgi:hypothetical protein